MIEEPDRRLTWILLERDGVAIDDLHRLVIDRSCMRCDEPSSAPMTRLFRCLRLTLLKWSTMDSSTSGCTLVWVIGALLIFKKYLNHHPKTHILI